MLFNKTPFLHNNNAGHSYIPVDTATNYRRIVVVDSDLTPEPEPNPENAGDEAVEPKRSFTPYYFFEYIVGQEMYMQVPLQVSRKKQLKDKTDIYILEETQVRTVYNSAPVSDPETFATMIEWLEANTIKAKS